MYLRKERSKTCYSAKGLLRPKMGLYSLSFIVADQLLILPIHLKVGMVK